MNKQTKLTITIIFLMLALAACDSTTSSNPSARPTSASSNDLLSQMFEAQDRATAAAENAQRVGAQAQRVAAQATTVAQMTREYVVLQGQQTRVAQDSRATQTVFAQNVQATSDAARANQTRYADETRATQTASAANANATAAVQTAMALHTRESASATATAQAVVALQTRESASATATSVASNAQSTRTSANATATVTQAGVITAQEKLEWEKRTESFRAVIVFLGWAFVLLGFVALVGWSAVQFGNAWALRVRTGCDATGAPYIILPPDRDGRQQIFLPSRAPGAVIEVTPQGLLPSSVASNAQSDDVTRRDQAIALMLAANNRTAREQVAALIEDGEPNEPTESAQSALPQMTIYKPFEPRPLSFAKQPTQLALPIGVKADGSELWIPTNDFTHALIGGPTGAGKTNFLHGWVQTWLAAKRLDLALYDGKEGAKFNRYAGQPGVAVINSDDALKTYLARLLEEMTQRFTVLRQAGAENLDDYNRQNPDKRMRQRIVLVDELLDALLYDDVAAMLAELARKSREVGFKLVMAAQLSESETVPRQLRANTTLRVAFWCVNHNESQSILGYAGAEKIEKTPGRLLVNWRGELIEAQAFKAELPPAKDITPEPTPQLLGSGERLEGDARRMAEWAVRHGAGWFVVKRIAAELGIRPKVVVGVANQLEQQGLLSPVQRDNGGQPIGRQISEKLTRLVTA